ncbi:MAG TPA: alpha-2-macroglobulin family protein [Chthoniobacterales bacterium]
MRRYLFLAVCLFTCLAHADEEAPRPEGGDVLIAPSEGQIEPGTTLTFTFPEAMVGADRIDVADQPLPFISKPKLEGQYLWKSQTEGVFTVRHVIAGAVYRLTLAPQLQDATAKPVNVPDWEASFTAPSFALATDFEERAQLGARPQISLTSTYDVHLAEVADHAYFQDRDSHERFPTEVIQSEAGPLEAHEFRVAPRAALPVGRTYDLIVDGLLDAAGRQPLPYLPVFPAGTTAPLNVTWVGAFNEPLAEPEIRLKFSDEIDPREAAPDKIRIEPAVPNLELLASGDDVTVKGDFDLAQHYQVTISPALKGERGYGLPAASRWGATFHPKAPGIVFPSSQVFLRARHALLFSFLQINTPAVTWKLARIPLEKLGAVKARVAEFDRAAVDPLTHQPLRDPRTGFAMAHPTELLVSAFELPVASSGTLAASGGDAETLRELRCLPADGKLLSGVYLLEASALLDDGSVVGNRSIVFVSDCILTEKRTRTATIVRIATMSDAVPVPGLTVRAVTAENIELGRAITDQNGCAVFSRLQLFPNGQLHADLFVADTANGPAVRVVGSGGAYPSGNEDVRPASTRRTVIITDRNLYRPGQVVRMKGIMRDATGPTLAVPGLRDVHWRVAESDGERVVAEGTVTLADEGGWEAAWDVPANAKLGHYQIRCKIGSEDYDGAAAIDLQEYRVPLFSVILEAGPEVGPSAHARLASAYFHGKPNAGAQVHWKATWTAAAEVTEDGVKRYNAYAEVGPRLDPAGAESASIEGDAKLDEHGFALVGCESPFKSNAAVGRCSVSWRADVTSLEGQTLTGGNTGTLFSGPARLGVQAVEQPGPAGGVKVRIEALDPGDQAVNNVAVRADLFHVTTKTTREQVAPFVYRYNNADQFTKIASQEAKTPAELQYPAAATGRYVIAVTAPGIKTPLVTDEATITGAEIAELPVENETGFQIDHRIAPFVPGETAVLTTKAPFAGTAWVSVETDEILDTLVVPLKGNAGRIELPIKQEYAPNAFVSVYLTRPGGEQELPRERFGYTELAVHRPEQELKIEPHLSSATSRPGEMVQGDVRVTCAGQPALKVNLLVFVVDDAVLQLGDWQVPQLGVSLYLPRLFGVRSFPSLASYQEKMSRQNLTQKGFTIGDGGDAQFGNVLNVRKEFQTLAYWQGNLQTDEHGQAVFEFTAPDNLTTYRVVAVGQTKKGQFGIDASVTVKISKPLLVEAALPRFLRDGDDVELRAVARQSFSASEELEVNCVTDASCPLSKGTESSQTASRDVPVVFRFKAKLADPDLRPVKIRFEARAKADPKMVDAVELTLPVQPPTILRNESIAGRFTGPQFEALRVMPEGWKHGRGQFGITVSTSPYLPEIAGLPLILEYPHGCCEQISTRLLGYAMMGELLAYLPTAETRDTEYRAMLAHGLQQLADSLLENGMLPYWPGGKSGHAFVTAEALWALDEAVKAGFPVPGHLVQRLPETLSKIVRDHIPASFFEKAFALFVLTQRDANENFAGAAQELYLHRNEMGDEGRALLALTLHRLNLMPKEKLQLLREISTPIRERAFDPASFTSTTRAEAICDLAFATIVPLTSPKRKEISDRLRALMETAGSLSTQENLWLLLGFKSMLTGEEPGLLSVEAPKGLYSKNGRSVAWLDRPLNRALLLEGLNPAALTYLLHAEYVTDEVETDRIDRGFRVERVLRNLTEAKRTGSREAPLRIGDQVLISYRINSRKRQNYVTLEDALPAGFETVNPDLAMVRRFFEVPVGNDAENVLPLSHVEMRDRSTTLYFDDVEPGTGTYSVLARATAAGTFRWPATQVIPMYDSRFSGLTPSSVCVISGE